MQLTDTTQGKYYESNQSEVGIILFHAYTGSPNDFNFLARSLNKAGYGVYCPTFKGHGTADVNDILSATMEEWQAQALQAYQAMKATYNHVLTFGLSLGGIFASWLMTHKQLGIAAGGVFNSPVVTDQPVDVSVHFVAYVRALYKKMGKEAQFEDDIDAIMDKHFDQMELLADFKESFKEALVNIEQPYYIAQSGQDEMIEASDAQLLESHLVNAHVDFHWFPNNTHVITVNRDRQAFEATVIEFIQKNS